MPRGRAGWERRRKVSPPGICTETPCSGFGLYLKKNRKLSKVVRRGKTHSHLHAEKIPLAAVGL